MTEAIARIEALLSHPIDRRKRAFFVEPPDGGRRLVIADIHGCYQTFSDLLSKISLTKDDQLFILGDMIDRGPYSFLVVERIATLIAEGYSVFPLRGNHEQLFLNFYRENPKKLISFARRQYAEHVHLYSRDLIKTLDSFFNILPYYYETNTSFLVHAGFNTRKKSPFDEWKDMIWLRDFAYRKKIFDKKNVIHGHVPLKIDKIQKGLDEDSRNINLDNGCVRANIESYGNLVCLNMDSRELFIQPNEDVELVE